MQRSVAQSRVYLAARAEPGQPREVEQSGSQATPWNQPSVEQQERQEEEQGGRTLRQDVRYESSYCENRGRTPNMEMKALRFVLSSFWT